jgi:GTP-binding protein
VLLHLVDVTQEDVAAAYKTVRAELKAYDRDLAKRKEIVALSKCDAVDEATLAKQVAALKAAARKTPRVLSAVSGKGVRDTLFAITKEIGKAQTREQEEENAERPPSWQP